MRVRGQRGRSRSSTRETTGGSRSFVASTRRIALEIDMRLRDCELHRERSSAVRRLQENDNAPDKYDDRLLAVLDRDRAIPLTFRRRVLLGADKGLYRGDYAAATRAGWKRLALDEEVGCFFFCKSVVERLTHRSTVVDAYP